MYVITENVIVILDGKSYLLEEGDRVSVKVDPMFPAKFARSALSYAGYDPNMKIIGSGENGYAFKIGNRVVKVTSDEGEYVVANQIKDLPSSSVVNIYTTKKVNMKLETMPSWWVEYWGFEAPGWESLNSLYVIEKDLVNTLDKETESKIDQMSDMIEDGTRLSAIIGKFGNLGSKFIKLINDLSNRGILLYDIRGENIGMHHNELKLIDTGGVKH